MLSRHLYRQARIIGLLLIAALIGCNKSKTPLFIVQTSVLPYGRKDILKEAFGRYPYFRNTGWVTSGTADIVATAKPDVGKVLSGRQESRSASEPSEKKYEQYFATVWYEFVFHVAADNNVQEGGVIAHEFVDGKSLSRTLSQDEQGAILRVIAERKYPDWMIRLARQTLSITTPSVLHE
jgi:hypothetical protein